MKNDFLKNSSKRFLFSAVMASAFIAGIPAPLWADVQDLEVVMQTVKVSGRVVDINGEPVIGASIQEKETSNGVITDIDGNFSFNVASRTAKIVISFIGYKTVELSAIDPKLKNVVMMEDSETLDEVVVIGYGTQKKGFSDRCGDCCWC